ncbi:MAG: two-component system, OmpR family, response regulator [Bacillota bacterium]|nr:two-component system, OmpR family, response regulator [Bacillota bacterium]
MKKILVVDDEAPILELVRFNLEKEGFAVITASDGEDGLRRARSEAPDLVILDLMLPGIDGIEVCQQLRRETNVPVLMLTAKTEEFDRVLGLSVGADDYVTKPFSPRELVARVKAQLRRRDMDLEETRARDASGRIRVGDLVIDTARFEVEVRGVRTELTPKEFDLLRVLVANRGKVLTRDFLLEKVWGYEYGGDTRTVDVHVRRLRQKIEEDDSRPTYIQTVHGVGYRFREDV